MPPVTRAQNRNNQRNNPAPIQQAGPVPAVDQPQAFFFHGVNNFLNQRPFIGILLCIAFAVWITPILNRRDFEINFSGPCHLLLGNGAIGDAICDLNIKSLISQTSNPLKLDKAQVPNISMFPSVEPKIYEDGKEDWLFQFGCFSKQIVDILVSDLPNKVYALEILDKAIDKYNFYSSKLGLGEVRIINNTDKFESYLKMIQNHMDRAFVDYKKLEAFIKLGVSSCQLDGAIRGRFINNEEIRKEAEILIEMSLKNLNSPEENIQKVLSEIRITSDYDKIKDILLEVAKDAAKEQFKAKVPFLGK